MMGVCKVQDLHFRNQTSPSLAAKIGGLIACICTRHQASSIPADMTTTGRSRWCLEEVSPRQRVMLRRRARHPRASAESSNPRISSGLRGGLWVWVNIELPNLQYFKSKLFGYDPTINIRINKQTGTHIPTTKISIYKSTNTYIYKYVYIYIYAIYIYAISDCAQFRGRGILSQSSIAASKGWSLMKHQGKHKS